MPSRAFLQKKPDIRFGVAKCHDATQKRRIPFRSLLRRYFPHLADRGQLRQFGRLARPETKNNNEK